MKLMGRINLLLLFSALTASVFFLVNRVIWQNLYLFSNSDLLYIPALIRDYFEGIYNWKLWVLPPAPSFFPDLFFFFLIGFLNSNLVISFFLYALFFACLCIYFTSKIFKLTEEFFSFERILKAITLFVTIWILLISVYPEDLGLFFFPSYHGSSFLFSLTLYLLSFTAYSRKKIFLFILMSTLAIISDKQILYTFYFPFLLTTFFLRHEKVEKHFTRGLMSLALSLLLGTLILKGLSDFGIFQIASIPIWAELKKNVFQLRAIHNFLQTLPELKQFIIDLYSDKFILFSLLIISIGQNFYYALSLSKSNYGVRFLSQFILWVYFLSVFSQMFFGVWGGFRYLWAFYLFPYLSILYHTGNSLSKILVNRNFRNIGNIRKFIYLLSRNSVRSQFAFLGIILLFLIITSFAFCLVESTSFSAKVPYPQFIACLDNMKDKYNISNGISDYWNAKHIRYLSQKKIIVNQVFTNLEKYNWVHNKEWYDKNKENKPIQYNFIIPERLDIAIILKKFGDPKKIIKCEGKEVYIYEKGFSY